MIFAVYNSYVLEDMLLEIKAAEDKASKIVSDAKIKAEKIKEDVLVEIEKINTQTQDELARLNLDTVTVVRSDDVPLPKVTVPKAKIDEAVKYITKEFSKRFK